MKELVFQQYPDFKQLTLDFHKALGGEHAQKAKRIINALITIIENKAMTLSVMLENSAPKDREEGDDVQAEYKLRCSKYLCALVLWANENGQVLEYHAPIVETVFFLLSEFYDVEFEDPTKEEDSNNPTLLRSCMVAQEDMRVLGKDREVIYTSGNKTEKLTPYTEAMAKNFISMEYLTSSMPFGIGNTLDETSWEGLLDWVPNKEFLKKYKQEYKLAKKVLRPTSNMKEYLALWNSGKRKFGKLTWIDTIIHPRGKHVALCQCECGNITSMAISVLAADKAGACGCQAKLKTMVH